MMLILSTLFCLFLTSYMIWFASKRRNKNNEPLIVPYWIPWVGSGIQYQKDPTGFLNSCKKKYGEIFTVFMGGEHFTFVLDPFSHPAIARDSKRLNFRLHTLKFIKRIFGFTRADVSTPTMGGLIPKYFQGPGLDSTIETTMKNIHNVIASQKDNYKDWKETDLMKFVFQNLFQASFLTLLGKRKNGIASDNMDEIMQEFVTFDSAFPQLAKGYPSSAARNALASRERLWKLLETGEREDIHEIYQEYKDIHQKKFFMREVFAFVWAGLANTTSSIFWALYFLLCNPEARSAALREITQVLEATKQKATDDFHFSRDEMDRMTTLQSIINETLRLSMSSAMLRKAVDDCDVRILSTGKTYKIRKGDNVMAPFQMTHYDEEIYAEPNIFKYDRFLDGDGNLKTKFLKHGKEVKYHLQPFGAGLSKCPGRIWAETEIKQFVTLVLLRFDVEIIQPRPDVTMLNDRTAIGSLSPSCVIPVRVRLKNIDV